MVHLDLKCGLYEVVFSKLLALRLVFNSSVVFICISACVGVCLCEFVHLPRCLTKTGHRSSGTSYEVKGVLAEASPK